ncbi:MAG: DUF5979 domain-containing protein [Bariatricus sp.]
MVCHGVSKKRGLIKIIISLMAAVLIMCGSMTLGASVYAADGMADSDQNYIVVEKKFVGIEQDQIPTNFQITVGSASDTYVLTTSTYSWNQIIQGDGTIRWQWKIIGVSTGNYTVSEQNESIMNYHVDTSGEGSVTVEAADFQIEQIEYANTCHQLAWPVKVEGDTNEIFAASLAHETGSVVISREPLSASQRETVTNYIKDNYNGSWQTPVYFYSVSEQIENGALTIGGTVITYDNETGQVVFNNKDAWSHVATLGYSITEANNPEIGITNTYTPITRDIVVKKAVSGGLGDTQKEFNFNYSYTNTEGNPVIGKFTLKNGEKYTITGVPLNGVLEIKEMNADGYDTTATYNGESVAVTGEKADAAKSLSIKVVDGEYEIVVNNHKDVNPDMGIQIGTFPYVLLMILVIAGAGFMLFGRFKRRDV